MSLHPTRDSPKLVDKATQTQGHARQTQSHLHCAQTRISPMLSQFLNQTIDKDPVNHVMVGRNIQRSTAPLRDLRPAPPSIPEEPLMLRRYLEEKDADAPMSARLNALAPFLPQL